MNKNLNRKNKEELYVKKVIELQRRWENPIDSNWSISDWSDWTDEALDEELKHTINLLNYEKRSSFFENVVVYAVYAVFVFIGLGIIGLLLFGIRQLFQ